MESTFGDDVDYAQLVKVYGRPSAQVEAHRRYSPTECIGTHTNVITGDPDQRHINTPYAERSNLSMHTIMERFTRLSLGFTKKVEHHVYMVALYAVWYHFVKMHRTTETLPAPLGT